MMELNGMKSPIIPFRCISECLCTVLHCVMDELFIHFHQSTCYNTIGPCELIKVLVYIIHLLKTSSFLNYNNYILSLSSFLCSSCQVGLHFAVLRTCLKAFLQLMSLGALALGWSCLFLFPFPHLLITFPLSSLGH